MCIANIIMVLSYKCVTYINDKLLSAYKRSNLSFASCSKVIQSFFDTFAHGLLTFADPHSRIKVFLVWLICTVWVTDLRGDIVLLAEHVISDTGAVGILQISVEIDFDDAVGDGLLVFFLGTSAAAVENEEAKLA